MFGKLLLDQRAKRHAGEELLLEDDGDADHVGLLGLDGRLHEMLEHVSVDVDLGVLHRLHDFGGHVDLVREVGFHRRHADARRRVDQRDDRRHLAERVDRPLELVDVVEISVPDDPLGLLGLPGEFGDALARQFAERQLQIHFPGFQIAFLRQLPEPVQLLRHLLEDTLEKVLAEVPVVHFQIDVFLDDGMAGGAEDGGQGRQAQIGFGGVPVRRKDQHHLHLPPARGFRRPAMQLDQFEAGFLALGIFNFHEDFRPLIHDERGSF